MRRIIVLSPAEYVRNARTRNLQRYREAWARNAIAKHPGLLEDVRVALEEAPCLVELRLAAR